MITFKNSVGNGIVFGIKAGLLTSLADGLFILLPKVYVPVTYPFHLVVFNLLFWIFIGALSGGLMYSFLTKQNASHDGRYYGVLCYLFPFAFLYGVAGRIFLPLRPIKAPPLNVFDKHLSFVWVTLLLTGLLWRLYKQKK